MTDNERIVLEFLGTWEQRSTAALLPYFTPDAHYIDMPLPPRHGLAEIEAYIDPVFGGFSVRIETLKIASDGDLVFTERIDWLGIDGQLAGVPRRAHRRGGAGHHDPAVGPPPMARTAARVSASAAGLSSR